MLNFHYVLNRDVVRMVHMCPLLEISKLLERAQTLMPTPLIIRSKFFSSQKLCQKQNEVQKSIFICHVKIEQLQKRKLRMKNIEKRYLNILLFILLNCFNIVVIIIIQNSSKQKVPTHNASLLKTWHSSREREFIKWQW